MLSYTRNLLLNLANSRFVAFLDADDVWLPNHLQELSNLIKEYHDRVTVFSTAFYRQRDSHKASHDLGDNANFFGILDYFKAMTQSSWYINSSVVCLDKDSIVNTNFFGDFNIKTNEDLIVWAKLTGNKGIAFSAEKTGINYIDASFAALLADFDTISLVYVNIIKMATHWSNKKYVSRYVDLFALKNICTVRLNSSSYDYSKLLINKFWKRNLKVNLFALCMLFVPRYIIKKKMII